MSQSAAFQAGGQPLLKGKVNILISGSRAGTGAVAFRFLCYNETQLAIDKTGRVIQAQQRSALDTFRERGRYQIIQKGRVPCTVWPFIETLIWRSLRDDLEGRVDCKGMCAGSHNVCLASGSRRQASLGWRARPARWNIRLFFMLAALFANAFFGAGCSAPLHCPASLLRAVCEANAT